MCGGSQCNGPYLHPSLNIVILANAGIHFRGKGPDLAVSPLKVKKDFSTLRVIPVPNAPLPTCPVIPAQAGIHSDLQRARTWQDIRFAITPA